ncbi:DUF7344 domain-containing protein [Halomicrococcus sp. SG-WS-1]|uniref:DUF7344 domain-containing protein n=1 Tax=Halomicrococcus sp. SG-WS-1 TaxID=3439057 RepID=UPI003F790169
MSSFDSPTQTSLETTFDVLANTYRRRLLMTLLAHDSQDGSLRIPADIIVSDEDIDRLTISMTHVHLPKLEDMGLIEWDQNTNEVRKGPKFEEIQPLLQLLDSHADEFLDG